MRAQIRRGLKAGVVDVTAYETGDEPEGSVDLPSELINEWQKADHALTMASAKIARHLRETGQRG